MKLTKALKEKNRLVGEINRIKQLISRENSRDVKSSSTVDASKLWEDLALTTDKLVALKTAIFKANVGIYGSIVRMSELKDRMYWIPSVSTNNEKTERPYGEHILVTEFKACKTREDIDNMQKELQDEIAKLQDEVDEYNAKTMVEV